MTHAVAPYDKLLDTQTLEFIRQTARWYPSDTIDFSMQKQREIYDAMCREFHTGYPADISATDEQILTDEFSLPLRRYTSIGKNSTASVVYFHGGGFVVGGLDSHDDVCAEICSTTGLDVTSVDYRLAPEHLHPAAFNDSLAAVKHEYQRTTAPLILCGDSAGGNLAAAVCHKLRDGGIFSEVEIAGQVLIYPGLGGDMTKGSYITHANAPALTTREVAFYSTIRTGYKEHKDVVTLAPLLDTNFAGLPDTVVFSAECDPLADDGRQYADAITQAGGTARWFNEAGLVHGFLRARHTVDRARDSFKRVTDAIQALAG